MAFGRKQRANTYGREMFEEILSEVGFPATQENIEAVAMLTGRMMVARVAAGFARVDQGRADAFINENQPSAKDYRKTPPDQYPARLQVTLEAYVKLGHLGPGFSQVVSGLPSGVRAALTGPGTEPGGFFDRPRADPLPRDWRDGA